MCVGGSRRPYWKPKATHCAPTKRTESRLNDVVLRDNKRRTMFTTIAGQ